MADPRWKERPYVFSLDAPTKNLTEDRVAGPAATALHPAPPSAGSRAPARNANGAARASGEQVDQQLPLLREGGSGPDRSKVPDPRGKPRVRRTASSDHTCMVIVTPEGRFIRGVWPDVEDPDGLVRRLREAFPRVNVGEEIRRARLWEELQPVGRQKRRHARFLLNWMAKARPTLAPPAKRRPVFLGVDEHFRPIYGPDET